MGNIVGNKVGLMVGDIVGVGDSDDDLMGKAVGLIVGSHVVPFTQQLKAQLLA